MIEQIYSDCEKLTILEMRMYLRAEISKFCVNEYKDMSIENKIFLYKLNSFLYFCNEFKKPSALYTISIGMCSIAIISFFILLILL